MLGETGNILGWKHLDGYSQTGGNDLAYSQRKPTLLGWRTEAGALDEGGEGGEKGASYGGFGCQVRSSEEVGLLSTWHWGHLLLSRCCNDLVNASVSFEEQGSFLILPQICPIQSVSYTEVLLHR